MISKEKKNYKKDVPVYFMERYRTEDMRVFVVGVEYKLEDVPDDAIARGLVYQDDPKVESTPPSVANPIKATPT